MKRRDVELFNLSFLDILAGALGAVLFLFIVVPKGDGKSPAVNPQLALTFDTVQMKFFGELPDSMVTYTAGDSLLSLVVDYGTMPSIVNCPEPRPCPKCPDTKVINKKLKALNAEVASLESQLSKEKKTPKRTPLFAKKEEKKKTPKKPTKTINKAQTVASNYKGTLPSVPCKFSVELKWDDLAKNVDLFLCKDGQCVYGGKKKRPGIGFWDSGKSKTSIFGGDLRSTQEAVRQFDAILEGDYEIYAQYKDSKEDTEKSVTIQGLVYTNTIENGEKGETFTTDLTFDKKQRTKLGTLNVQTDGSFKFNKNF